MSDPSYSAPRDFRRGRSRLSVGDVGTATRILAGVLLLLVVLAPWPFGGVEMTRWLWPVPLLVLACWTLMLGRSTAPSPVAPWAVVPALVAFGYAAFQLTPLPGETLARLSPQALHYWSAAQSLTQPIESPLGVSAPISLEPEGGRLQMTWLALGLCVFVLSAQFLRSDFGMTGLFAVAAAVGAALAAFAIVQAARFDGKLFWFFEISARSTPFGPFINRNHGGAFMNLCLAGAVGLFWFLSRRREDDDAGRWSLESESFKTRILGAIRHLEGKHILAFAAVVFVIGGLVSSMSRGAAASAAAGLGAALLAGRLQRRDAPRTIPVGLYLTAVLSLGAAAAFVYLIGAEDKAFARFHTLLNEGDAGQKSRARHWNDMVPAARDYFLAGSGLGSYVHVHRIYTPNNHGLIFEHADNTYLEILVELGVGGLALAALFILSCARSIYVVLTRDRSEIGRVFAVGAAYVLGTQALHHAVDFPLYSPANLILFSAWMGAACGRAGRIASAARSEGRKLRLVSLPLGRWQTAGALPTGMLLVLGGWGWWEASVQERVDWRLRDHRRHPATVNTSLRQADLWVQELDALAARHPQRADLRYQLAERWIDRCRVQIRDAVLAKDPKQSPDDLWTKSDLMVLYGQLFGAARMGQGAMLEAVRASPAVSENLPRARDHLLAACQLSPLYVAPRLRLAMMPYLLESPSKREMLVDQAAALAPGDSYVQFQIGFLEFHADRHENVLPAWRKSLEISQAWVKPILFHASQWLGLERALKEAIPPDPSLLVNVAEQHLGEPNKKKEREQTFRRALEALPDSTLSRPDRNEVAGRAFVGLGEYENAARCFEEATEEVKNRPYLWMSLAECYEKLGKRREAARALGTAAGLLPGRADILKRVSELRQETPETPQDAGSPKSDQAPVKTR
jgi:tetratricopeptide (TPR) repeat protein/O-antigen ligase